MLGEDSDEEGEGGEEDDDEEEDSDEEGAPGGAQGAGFGGAAGIMDMTDTDLINLRCEPACFLHRCCSLRSSVGKLGWYC